MLVSGCSSRDVVLPVTYSIFGGKGPTLFTPAALRKHHSRNLGFFNVDVVSQLFRVRRKDVRYPFVIRDLSLMLQLQGFRLRVFRIAFWGDVHWIL